MQRREPSPYWPIGKRALDVAAVVITAPVTLPLALMTAALVRIRLGSPVLFRQRRLGRDEREFDILKFRTMVDAVTDAGDPLPDVDRLTPTGRWLRKSSLDELPQLLNVLRGEMSIIGPRPLYPRYKDYYFEQERLRHTVRPGLTGLAQVSGRNGDDVLWASRLALDVEYVRRQSFRQDLAILIRTVKTVAAGSDVGVPGVVGQPLDVVRGFPIVDDVTIRRFEKADVPARVRWMRDPRSRHQHAEVQPEASEASVQRWLEVARATPGRFEFVVTRVGSDAPLAMLSLESGPEDRDPQLRVLVDPDGDSELLRSRSIAVLTASMARQDGPHACWLSVDCTDAESIALYERSGFVTVGPHGSGRLRMRMRVGGSKTPDE